MLGIASLSLLLALGAASPAPASSECSQGSDILAPNTIDLALGDIGAQSTCIATCTQGPNVSCSGTNCSAVHQNCGAGITGYAVCDGSYTYCAACPGSVCTEGEIKYVKQSCCVELGRRHARYQCQGGQWVYTGFECWPDHTCIQW